MPVYTPDKIKVINKSTMKQRGWTDTLLRSHFPTVMTDGIAFLYLLSEVIEKEKSADFVAQMEKRKARKEKAEAKEKAELEAFTSAKSAARKWAEEVAHEDLCELMGKEMSCNMVHQASRKAMERFLKEFKVNTRKLYYAHDAVYSAANNVLKMRYPKPPKVKGESGQRGLNQLISDYMHQSYDRSQACILLHRLMKVEAAEQRVLKGVPDEEIKAELQLAIHSYQQSQIEASQQAQKVVRLSVASSPAVEETLASLAT